MDTTQLQQAWRAKRAKTAFLALEDGTVFRGYGFGANRDAVGEVVFNTGMTGYQEVLTDPSYAGQFVVMTYPEIGNTGINDDDPESRQLFLQAFIVHDVNAPANWRATTDLDSYLKLHNVPGFAGLDTRALTSRLRDQGTLKGYLCLTGEVTPEDAAEIARNWEGLDGQDYAGKVSVDACFPWDPDGSLSRSFGVADDLPEPDLKVVAYDYGIKWNILRWLRKEGMELEVVPAGTTVDDLLARRPDAVFYSNGPADPSAVSYAIDNARQLIGKVPIMGICLGHQLLSLASGAQTRRLKFGHHGCNHPVMDLTTGVVEITTQNHNFVVDEESVAATDVEVTHRNLNDQSVEGIRHRKEPMFAVQYHPEAGPGPHDSSYLFKRFRQLIEEA